MAIELKCAMVRAMVKDFFNDRTKGKVKDMIIAHLLTCHNCENMYINYSLDIGLTSWTPLKAAKKFLVECGEDDFLCERTHLALGSDVVTTECDSEVILDQWTRAAKGWNIGKLKKVKAFSDLIIGMDYLLNKSEESQDDHFEFLKYETKKICQKIDHLELCLSKSGEQTNEK